MTNTTFGAVTKAGVERAFEVCKPFGGLKALYTQSLAESPEYEVVCKDGKLIRGRAKDGQ